MLWLTVLACVPLLGLLLMVVIGRFLPERHLVSRRASFRTPAEEVFDALSDVRQMNEWRTDLRRVLRARGKGELPAWQEVGRFTTRKVAITTLRPPFRINADIENGVVPMKGTMQIHVKPAGGGCVVTITEEASVPSPLFRFAVRYIVGLHAPLDIRLSALGLHFRERVKPEDGPTAPGR